MTSHRRPLTTVEGRTPRENGLVMPTREVSPTAPRCNDLARAMLASIGDAVIMSDLDGAVTYLNPAAERITGWPLREARGRQLAVVMPLIAEATRQPIPDRVARCLAERRAIDLEDGVLLLRRDGTELPVGDSTAPVLGPDGIVEGVIMVVQDESEQRRVGHQLSYEATHDALTGLFNRRGFERRLVRVVADLEGSTVRHVLLYLDLDGFKLVNDTWGHQAGDDLLRDLGRRLDALTRSGDSVARIGGDEFAILLENCPPAEGRRIADAVRLEVSGCGVAVREGRPTLGVSIGVVDLVSGCDDVDTILHKVDSACYRAKRGGGNRIRRPDRRPSGGTEGAGVGATASAG